jgi:hypothetical protein
MIAEIAVASAAAKAILLAVAVTVGRWAGLRFFVSSRVGMEGLLDWLAMKLPCRTEERGSSPGDRAKPASSDRPGAKTAF